MIKVEWTCPECEHEFITLLKERDYDRIWITAYCPECNWLCQLDTDGEVIE